MGVKSKREPLYILNALNYVSLCKHITSSKLSLKLKCPSMLDLLGELRFPVLTPSLCEKSCRVMAYRNLAKPWITWPGYQGV